MKLVAVEYYEKSIDYNFYTIVCEQDGIYCFGQYRKNENGNLTYWCSVSGPLGTILAYRNLDEAVCYGGFDFMPPKPNDLEAHKQLLLYCEQSFNNNKDNIIKKLSE